MLKALKDLPNDLQIRIEIYVTDTAGAHEEAGREWDDDSVPPSRDESEEKAGGSANSKDALDPFPFGDVLTIKKGGRPDLDKILSGEVGKMGGGTISVNGERPLLLRIHILSKTTQSAARWRLRMQFVGR